MKKETIIDVEIKGISPLLMHRFPMEDPESKSKKKTGNINYKDEVDKALYTLEDGTPYTPATHIEGSLMKSASNFQITGRGKKTYKDLVKSALFVNPDAIPHVQPKWEIDARPVVVQRARVVRYRPIFKEWSLVFQIAILDEQLPTDVVKEILDYAGRYVGIGDFRPRFGRFIVTRFEERPVTS